MGSGPSRQYDEVLQALSHSRTSSQISHALFETATGIVLVDALDRILLIVVAVFVALTSLHANNVLEMVLTDLSSSVAGLVVLFCVTVFLASVSAIFDRIEHDRVGPDADLSRYMAGVMERREEGKRRGRVPKDPEVGEGEPREKDSPFDPFAGKRGGETWKRNTERIVGS